MIDRRDLFIIIMMLGSANAGKAYERHGRVDHECKKGLLSTERRTSEKHIALKEFLSLSIMPLHDIEKELSVQVYFQDSYQRAVYELDLSQSVGVGCWVTLRHTRSSDIIVKVLWPGDVLWGHCTTILTLVLKAGVLRITAVRQPSMSLAQGKLGHNTKISFHYLEGNKDRSNPIKPVKFGENHTKHEYKHDNKGPFLLLTSLKVVHHPHEEPQTVYLHMSTPKASLYYSLNCNTDELEWAWQSALGVRTDVASVAGWLLLAVLMLAFIAVILQWKTQFFTKLYDRYKSMTDDDDDEHIQPPCLSAQVSNGGFSNPVYEGDSTKS